MSRSYKKPYGPCCVCKTKVLKRWKKSYNSKMRNTSIDDVPDKRIAGPIWVGPSDGKTYYGEDPKWKRK